MHDVTYLFPLTSRLRLPSLSFAVFDTETTGIMPRVSEVIEFASMRADEGKIVDTWEQLYGSASAIPGVVQVLTRIRPEDTEGKPLFKDSLDEVEKRLAGVDILVGQNLAFDLAMLKGAGLDLTDRPWVDTSLLASLVFPEFRSYSLQYMSNSLKLNHEPAHRALGDVIATTELLGKIWERLAELPADKIAEAKAVMERSSEGYKLLFRALPSKGGKGGEWAVPLQKPDTAASGSTAKLMKPPAGVVEVREESLDPGCLQHVVNAAAQDKSSVHWIAVKNLESNLRRLHLPESASVIQPPNLLLNPEAAETLAEQKELTADEATLLLKLMWFKPRTRADVSIHGGEKDIWFGKMTCTSSSDPYRDQFKQPSSVFILDHRQLLRFTRMKDGPIGDGAHIIIDDASMLEDTATKAWGEYCGVDALRAASAGDDELTRFTDLLTLWTEKIRGEEDTHFLTGPDMEKIETKGLKESLSRLLTRTDLAEKTTEQLTAIQELLNPAILTRDIVWCERRYDGSVTLLSAPRSVDSLLHDRLYSKYAVTLLAPAGAQSGLPEIVAAHTEAQFNEERICAPTEVNVSFPTDLNFERIMADPPDGKTVCLLGSKRVIEQAFVNHTEQLEEKKVTLICQGMSGGQNRMESEFTAAESPAILLITPFMYESLDLPRGTVDRMVIDSVPFDHPNQATVAHRKQHYKNGFMEYCIPRTEFRLFRLLRTFCRHRSPGGEVIVTDRKLHERDYGRRLKAYLGQFGSASIDASPSTPEKSTPAKKASNKGGDSQLQMPL